MVGKWQPEEIVTKSVILSTLCLGILAQMFCSALCLFRIALLMVSSIRVCASEVTSGKLARSFRFFSGWWPLHSISDVVLTSSVRCT